MTANTRFFLDAAEDGRITLGHDSQPTTLGGGSDQFQAEGGIGGVFRWIGGDTVLADSVTVPFRVGDRLFTAVVSSEIRTALEVRDGERSLDDIYAAFKADLAAAKTVAEGEAIRDRYFALLDAKSARLREEIARWRDGAA